MRTKIAISLGALALGAVLAVPAFAQEVWQSYPFTISTPAFGPGPVQPAPALRAHAARPLYNVVPPAAAPQSAMTHCDVTQSYPMTISTPAYGTAGSRCQ